MQYNLNENIFELLDKIDLNEELDPSIDGEALLYEDNEFSRTPAEADKSRTEAEEVLGFELTGNQADYLASNWAEFYRNAHECADMKSAILSRMDSNKDTRLTDKQREAMELYNEDSVPQTRTIIDDDDDIDYYEESNPDALHPNQEVRMMEQPPQIDMGDNGVSQNTGNAGNPNFTPMQVQTWGDSQPKNSSEPKDAMAEMNDMANELVGDDVDDDFETDVDYSKINNILSKGQN